MKPITTVLTTSGNSVAVRLPKELLAMSGLNGKSSVTISAQRDQITITKSIHPREGWESQIDALLMGNIDPSAEFSDLTAADNDGLEDLPWDGPSFEDWQKTHDKLS